MLKLKDLPEVNFIDVNVEEIINSMITEYEKAYYESTGIIKKLYPGDPIRIFLYTQALREAQLRICINETAKQNLLAYATNENLDNLGAFSNTERLKASAATTIMKFNLSTARAVDEFIEKGIRVSPGSDIYFETTENTIIKAGATEVFLNVKCTETGTIGNDFRPGQINILVDPLPYISSVENTITSSGGTEKEDDESYRERIYLAPEEFSVAGPTGAYESLVKKYSTLISDVKVENEEAGTVDISVLLRNGELPEQEFLNGLHEKLSDKSVRPLTDLVRIKAPTTVTYNINVTYYISTSDADNEQAIKQKAEAAIDDYVLWQKTKIKRDINPSMLISNLIKAGVKRVEVTSPIYQAITTNSIATVNSKTVTYGGLEDE